MNDFAKGVIVFTGGVISGLGIGISYTVYCGLKNEKIRKGVVEAVTDKVLYGIFGDTTCETQNRNHKVSYREYAKHRRGLRPLTGDLLFDNEDDLRQVLDNFTKLIEVYGYASVADLYNLCGQPSGYLDSNVGWNSVDGFEIYQNETSYMLKYPEPVVL